ncbi:MAG: right-handed parallel beta-helix repeat-containing protein, partial [Candidatus Kariarchaeaceae archaeon]
MKRILIFTFVLLLVQGFVVPVAAEPRAENYNPAHQIEILPNQNPLGFSSSFTSKWVDLWKHRITPKSLSEYDYKIEQSSLQLPNLSSLIQSGYDFESELDIELNGPPDPKKKNPINIDENRDLRKFPGKGTAEDPKVIEGFYFENSRKNLLQIQNTDLYIVVRFNIFNGANGGNVAILLDNAQHVTIADNDIYNAAFGITVSNSMIGTIESNTIHENTANGITLSNSHYFTISSNEIYLNGGDGIFFKDSNYNILIGNTIYSNGVSGSPTLNSVSLLSVTNNELVINAGFAGSGMFLDPSDNNKILNNTISDNAAIGVYLLSSDETLIDGNTISYNGLTGVFLENSSSNTISNNDVDGNGASSALSSFTGNAWDFVAYAGFAGSGMFLDPSYNNDVTGNNFTNNLGNGILSEFSDGTTIDDNKIDDNGLAGIKFIDSDDSSITNNIITNNGGSAPAPPGGLLNNIFDMKVMAGFAGSGMFLDPSFNNEVSGNLVMGNKGNGLYLLESANTDISNNYFIDNDAEGIYLANSSYNDITGNTVSLNGYETSTEFELHGMDTFDMKLMAGFAGSGMFLDPSPYNTISNNTVTSNAGSGIYFLETDNSLISDNDISLNYWHGIFFEDSNYNTIYFNEIEENGHVDPGEGLSLSAGFAGSGMFLDPSHSNTVESNNVTLNYNFGLSIEATSGTTIDDNRFIENGNYGVAIDVNSSNSLTQNNNFQDNNGQSNQALDNGINNLFTTNFWNDHDNADENFDGISDEPYVVDGDAENTDNTASNIPNGLNFYTAIMESSPRVLNADSDGTPITLKVWLSDGYRILSVDLNRLTLNRTTITPFDYHIIDIQTFTVTFARQEVNDLINSLGIPPPFNVVFELFGRVNDDLLELTAYD